MNKILLIAVLIFSIFIISGCQKGISTVGMAVMSPGVFPTIFDPTPYMSNPTQEPTATPTQEPTATPTQEPTATPTPHTYCGDGIKQNNPPNAARNKGPNNDGNEDCDDGANGNDYDQCYDNCVDTYCGDGKKQTPNGKGKGGPDDDGNERCDDGDTYNTNLCTNDCTWAECGDGYIWKGVEDCEGNNLDWRICKNLGFDYGTLKCYPVGHPERCKYNTTGCYYYACKTDPDCEGKSTDVYCQGGDVWGNKVKCYEHVCVRDKIEDCDDQGKLCYEGTFSEVGAECVGCKDDNDCKPHLKCSYFGGDILKGECDKLYYDWRGNLIIRDPEDWGCVYKTYRTCRSGTKCQQEGNSARCVIKDGEDCEDNYECPTYHSNYCKNNIVWGVDCINGRCNRLGVQIDVCSSTETCKEISFGGTFYARCVPNEKFFTPPPPQTASDVFNVIDTDDTEETWSYDVVYSTLGWITS